MTAKELFEASGINSYQELAAKTGLSKQRAYQIWRGEGGIGRKKAKVIGEALGINVALLLSCEATENGR